MEIKELIQQRKARSDPRFNSIQLQFEKLLDILRMQKLPDEIIIFINKNITELNSGKYQEAILNKETKIRQTKIIKRIEKQLALVPQNFYRKRWLTFGIAIGLPLGIAVSASLIIWPF